MFWISSTFDLLLGLLLCDLLISSLEFIIIIIIIIILIIIIIIIILRVFCSN
jgi:hypothetical protein